MGCGLLVADQDVLDLVRIVESVIDVDDCTAGIAEDVINTLKSSHR